MIVTPAERLIYCSADHFTKKVQSVAYSKEYRNNTNFIVIIDGSQMKAIDVTVAKV